MASEPVRANMPPLSLHVPEPKFRPGDPVDFADVDVPPAGSARRPDTAEPAGRFTELAYTLVRVLDEEGGAVGPWDPKLSPERLRQMLRAMALNRAFDERIAPLVVEPPAVTRCSPMPLGDPMKGAL